MSLNRAAGRFRVAFLLAPLLQPGLSEGAEGRNKALDLPLQPCDPWSSDLQGRGEGERAHCWSVRSSVPNALELRDIPSSLGPSSSRVRGLAECQLARDRRRAQSVALSPRVPTQNVRGLVWAYLRHPRQSGAE